MRAQGGALSWGPPLNKPPQGGDPCSPEGAKHSQLAKYGLRGASEGGASEAYGTAQLELPVLVLKRDQVNGTRAAPSSALVSDDLSSRSQVRDESLIPGPRTLFRCPRGRGSPSCSDDHSLMEKEIRAHGRNACRLIADWLHADWLHAEGFPIRK